MKDSVIKGNGNSRYLKSSLEGITTWEQFRAALAAGTLPIDLNGINPEGFQQLGDPFNKVTLLKDTTAALLGLPDTAVPDDALRLLSRFQSGLGNEYVWAKISEQIQNEYDENTSISLIGFAGMSGRTVTFVYGDTYSVNDDGIHTTINQPNEITVNSNSPISIFDGMKGKWWSYKDYSNENKDVCYMPASATVIRDMSSGYANYKTDEPMTYRSNFHNVTIRKIIGYVNSHSPDTYPPTIDDGYDYESLGQLGDKVRIATGSYKGTGTYGSSNPNSLTFRFVPKFVFIQLSDDGNGYNFFACNGAKYAHYNQASRVPLTWDSTTLSWYSGDVQTQLNQNNREYKYIALG